MVNKEKYVLIVQGDHPIDEVQVECFARSEFSGTVVRNKKEAERELNTEKYKGLLAMSLDIPNIEDGLEIAEKAKTKDLLVIIFGNPNNPEAWKRSRAITEYVIPKTGSIRASEYLNIIRKNF